MTISAKRYYEWLARRFAECWGPDGCSSSVYDSFVAKLKDHPSFDPNAFDAAYKKHLDNLTANKA